MLDLKHKHLSSNQSDCGTLRSTSTLRSKANSSVYNASRSEYETATIKRSHSQSHRNSSLIAGSSTLMRADLDSDQLFTWNWKKPGHMSDFTSFFFYKKHWTLYRNLPKKLAYISEKLTSKRRRNIYGVLCYVFVYIIQLGHERLIDIQTVKKPLKCDSYTAHFRKQRNKHRQMTKTHTDRLAIDTF